MIKVEILLSVKRITVPTNHCELKNNLKRDTDNPLELLPQGSKFQTSLRK